MLIAQAHLLQGSWFSGRGLLRLGLFLSGILMAWVFSGPAMLSAATLAEVRPQFQINERYTNKGQHHATVAMDAQGLFMVAWNTHSKDWEEIQGRAYFADGQPWTNDFLVNQMVQKGDQYSPDVACSGVGEWVVVWPSSETDTTTTIYAKLYSSDNIRKQLEFVVDPDYPPSTGRSRPDVAMFANGDFIVIWDAAASDTSGMNFFVRLFDDRGNPLTDRVQINQTPSAVPPRDLQGYPIHTGTPDVAVKEVGGQMKAFASWKRWHEADPMWTDIVAREFNLHTMTFEDEFEISPVDSGALQDRPMVDMNAGGDILVVWQEVDQADGLNDVHMRKYNAAAGSWGAVLAPPGNDAFEQHRPHGLLSASGGIALGWTRAEPGQGQDNVYLMMYDALGNPLLDSEFMVNTTVVGFQRRPALAMKESGGMTRLAVVWESDRDDGSDFGICGAVYDFDGFPDMAAGPGPQGRAAASGLPGFGLEAADLNLQARTANNHAPAAEHADILSSYPNPFNPITTISFSLDRPATVSLDVHDLAGRRIKVLADGQALTAGRHGYTWYGRDSLERPVAAGVYLLRLNAGDRVAVRRVTLVR